MSQLVSSPLAQLAAKPAHPWNYAERQAQIDQVIARERKQRAPWVERPKTVAVYTIAKGRWPS